MINFESTKKIYAGLVVELSQTYLNLCFMLRVYV